MTNYLYLKLRLKKTNLFEDNEWLDLYCELILNNLNTKKEKFKTNVHHIIPRCYYKHNNLEVDNSKENLVNLLYKDHILAHYYLCKCAKESRFKYCMLSSIEHILGLSKKIGLNLDIDEFNLDDYQELYQLKCAYHSKQLKGLFKGNNNPAKQSWVGAKISKSKLGHKVSKETREKIGNKNRGRKWTLEERERRLISYKDMNKGDKNGMYGKIPWNKGKHNVYSEETRKKMSEKAKNRQSSTKGRLYIHTMEGKRKMVPKEQLDEYLNHGYILGYK